MPLALPQAETSDKGGVWIPLVPVPTCGSLSAPLSAALEFIALLTMDGVALLAGATYPLGATIMLCGSFVTPSASAVTAVPAEQKSRIGPLVGDYLTLNLQIVSISKILTNSSSPTLTLCLKGVSM